MNSANFDRCFATCTKENRGQALVEFCLALTLFLFMIFAAFETARYASLDLRLASTTREAARLFVAEEIEPDYITTTAGYDANVTKLRPLISTKVYTQITNMVSPANIDAKGKVIVSILRRFDQGENIAGSSKPLAATNSTPDESDDRVLIEYQFAFPQTDSYSTWASQLGGDGKVGAVVSTNLLPTAALSIDERTVAVEIFQETDLISPPGILKWSGFQYVYDRAIF